MRKEARGGREWAAFEGGAVISPMSVVLSALQALLHADSLPLSLLLLPGATLSQPALVLTVWLLSSCLCSFPNISLLLPIF